MATNNIAAAIKQIAEEKNLSMEAIIGAIELQKSPNVASSNTFMLLGSILYIFDSSFGEWKSNIFLTNLTTLGNLLR